MLYPYDDLIEIMADIYRFTVKKILVNSKSSYSVFTWEVVVALQVNLMKLRKVITILVGIGGRPIKVERSMELPMTLGDKDRKRIVR